MIMVIDILFLFIRIEDFVIKDTSLQKYKTDAEHKISTLMNALQEKKTEIEALNQHLARLKVYQRLKIIFKILWNITLYLIQSTIGMLY